MTRPGAELRWRFCFASRAEEKIGDASEQIDAFVRRTIAQDCV
jgi:hypothetical protein